MVSGNGFDLAHGLKTTYMDFLDSIKEGNYKNKWINYFSSLYRSKRMRGEKWIDLEEEIKQVLDKIKSLPSINVKDGSRTLLYKNMTIEDIMFQRNVQSDHAYVKN